MANPRLSAGDKDTQAIFTTIRKIRHIYTKNPNSYIVVLWDGRSWRKDIYAEYKANRETTEKQTEERAAYYDQSKAIRMGLSLLGVTQASAENMEADDLAAILSIKFVDMGGKVELLTADKDWLQLVNENVTWVDPINDRICNHKNFEQFTGYDTTAKFVEAKCILGDTGDNVFGIKGFGPKTLDKMYEIYRDLPHFFSDKDREATWLAHHGKNMPKVLRELDMTEAFKIMARNHNLMCLHTFNRPKPIRLKQSRYPLDEEGFETFCYENAFLSFTNNFKAFIQPFKDNINTLRK